jgi:hypothetical protein
VKAPVKAEKAGNDHDSDDGAGATPQSASQLAKDLLSGNG